MIRVFVLGLATLSLAGCQGTVDPYLGATLSIGSNGVNVYPSLGISTEHVSIEVSP